jgi:CRISPR-associated protein Csb2
LTENVRNEAARRLNDKRLFEADRVHDAIVGRRDSNEVDKTARVRIVPLPSIGHRHADHAVRRILVEVPPNCPLRADDVEWAFSGLLLVSDQGEVLGELATATERKMLAHYGIEDARPSRVWHTITPAALPRRAARRRIDPERIRIEAKGGTERAEEESRAASAVVQALRHAGMSARTSAVTVRREPFAAKGARAEAFAPGTRFAKENLWHAQIAFSEPVRGPLVLGDGRYLGLGLMAPVREASLGVAVFSLPPEVCVAIGDREDLLRAVRRALMALSRRPDDTVPMLFSGHEADGSPASSGSHRHVFLAAADLDGDGFIEQVIVAAPWACDRSVQPGRGEAPLLDRVVSSLAFLRAGRLGAFPLQIAPAEGLLFGPARSWESHTDYRPTRHAGRGKEPASALLHEITGECGRRGLAKPKAEILQMSVGPRGSVAARLRLQFAVAVPGPLLLGRNSHQGGGLFCISR